MNTDDLQELPNEYSGPLARLYDALHMDDCDEAFWLEQASGLPEGASILELGCGNGRLLLPLARAGHEVWGLDASADMLNLLRERLNDEPDDVQARVHLVQDSFDTFNLRRHFGLIFFSCNTFQHLVGTDLQLATLARVRDHLLPEGRLIIDQEITDAAAALEVNDQPQVFEFPERELPDDGVELWRIMLIPRVDFRMGRLTDLLRVSRVQLDAEGHETEVEAYRSKADMALLFPRELKLLLRHAGFHLAQVYGDYDGRAHSGDDDSMILVARVDSQP